MSGKAVPSPAITSADTTEVRATVAPTARSNPPVISTIIWPIDTSTR